MRSQIEILTGPLISNPKTNVTYRLACPILPKGYIEIYVRGMRLNDIASIYVYSQSYMLRDGTTGHFPYWTHSKSYESQESLPPNFEKIPAIFRRIEKEGKHYLACVNALIINFGTTFTIYERVVLLPKELQLWNNQLQKECQSLLGAIPVKNITSSIYKPSHLPSAEFLHALHYQFWRYNKNKLAFHNRTSDNLCYVRAHVVSALLSLYGIDTIKINQFWNDNYWLKWNYHCAVLLVDSDNNKWVWDTWERPGPFLVTMKEWVSNKDYPRPNEISLCNRSVFDMTKGFPWLNFKYQTSGEKLRYRYDMFQFLFSDTIPNPPVHSIKSPSKQNSFFKCTKMSLTNSEILEEQNEQISKHSTT